MMWSEETCSEFTTMEHCVKRLIRLFAIMIYHHRTMLKDEGQYWS